MTYSMRNAYLRFVPVLFLIVSLASLGTFAQDKPTAPGNAPRYKDASLPIQDRVADLLPRMTLEEKVYQLTGGWDGQIEVLDPTGTFTTETARKTLSAEWGAEVKFTPRDHSMHIDV